MRSHHKQSPTAKHIWEAHSTYTARLGVPDRRRYRRTPPGCPTVGDLVRPGDTVSTFYSTGGVVIDVKEHYAAPNGETLSHFTIFYVRPIARRSTAMPIVTGSTTVSPSATIS